MAIARFWRTLAFNKHVTVQSLGSNMNAVPRPTDFLAPAEHLIRSLSRLRPGHTLWRVYERLNTVELELVIRLLHRGRIAAVMKNHCHSLILEIRRLD